MSTDLTFFTNEPDQTLLDRFKVTIEQNTRFFDVLVGFFRTSGFYHIYKSLKKTENVRIRVYPSATIHAKVKVENISVNRAVKENLKK